MVKRNARCLYSHSWGTVKNTNEMLLLKYELWCGMEVLKKSARHDFGGFNDVYVKCYSD